MKKRVLARSVAEDLRSVHVPAANGGMAASPTVTANDGHGHPDITNVGGDGD